MVLYFRESQRFQSNFFNWNTEIFGTVTNIQAVMTWWHAQQRATKKTTVHIEFMNFFCTTVVHGDTSTIIMMMMMMMIIIIIIIIIIKVITTKSNVYNNKSNNNSKSNNSNKSNVFVMSISFHAIWTYRIFHHSHRMFLSIMINLII